MNGVWKAIRIDKDPADRLIVATARAYDCLLVMADIEILAYLHVELLRCEPDSDRLSSIRQLAMMRERILSSVKHCH